MYFLKKYNVQIIKFAEDGSGDIFVIIWVNIYFLKKYNVQISKFAGDGFYGEKMLAYFEKINNLISRMTMNFDDKPILTPRLASFSLSSAMEFERSIR